MYFSFIRSVFMFAAKPCQLCLNPLFFVFLSPHSSESFLFLIHNRSAWVAERLFHRWVFLNLGRRRRRGWWGRRLIVSSSALSHTFLPPPLFFSMLSPLHPRSHSPSSPPPAPSVFSSRLLPPTLWCLWLKYLSSVFLYFCLHCIPCCDISYLLNSLPSSRSFSLTSISPASSVLCTSYLWFIFLSFLFLWSLLPCPFLFPFPSF